MKLLTSVNSIRIIIIIILSDTPLEDEVIWDIMIALLKKKKKKKQKKNRWRKLLKKYKIKL